ncbi:M14 family zinc carboxypeptidase [Anthocerotibacter panamensis]|uniref:M14 family zinc carboxypeptidase n=1 Tax=Anthocerotibacter panamensis TaxID=2857077 RepID=UPI001C4026E3|nr:M14 family zinc carboxypeptidase [Anthocerotibacter panamensis]
MRVVLLALLLAVSLVPVQAQTKFDFYSRGPYRPEVPRPATVTGYEPGMFQTPHGQIVRVVEKIAAAAPDRVRLIENGETWEHRKLYLAVVSAPENIARLDEIRANVSKLADPRQTTPQQAEQLARTTPLVVWFNFGIHGNESASYEAVQQVLYQLAASDEPATLDILKNVVVVINTMHNPDGHERFAVWENSVAVGDPEPGSLEHREPYQTYGRVNHYRFDMNRDMLAQSQPENHALARGVRMWHPQVFIDFHGQVSNYFFPPAAEPINKNLPLERSRYWYETFGRGNGTAFDRYGWNYYVRHIFDIFYAGYMDSWSSLNGATGMTYETDSGGPTSLSLKLDDDTLLPFRQGIAKHFTAALATLTTAATHRTARLKDYYLFFKTGMDESKTEAMKRIVLLPGKDPGRAAQLVRNLIREGIEVSVTRKSFSSGQAHDYLGSPATSRDFPAGTYLIELNQPQKRLAKAHLEPRSELDQEFVRRELERRTRNEKRGENAAKENYEFYDITAWSLPLALGVEAYWTEDTPVVNAARVLAQDPVYPIGGARVPGSDLSAQDRQPLPGLQGGVEGAQASSAYLIPYGSDSSRRLVVQLLKEGYKIAVATHQLSAGGRNWPIGTLFARVSRNPESLHTRIAALATDLKARVVAVNSSYPEQGDTGIGSEYVTSLKPPRIAVLWDEATSPTGYGALWYTLERDWGLEFTPFSAQGIKNVNLAPYTVLVIPQGSAGGYQRALGKEGMEKLKTWVKNGGVLVGIGGGASLFTQKEVDLTSARLVGEIEEPGDKDAKKTVAPLPVPGASFQANLDRDHYLSYGYSADHLVVLLEGDSFLRPSKKGVNVVTFADHGPLTVAGFVWPNNTETLLKGTSYLIDEPTGAGHVILFAEDPNYRYLWRTGSGLLLNALLLAPSF